MGLRDRLRRALRTFPAGLARLGLLERQPATEALDLAAPVMVTGALRVLLRMADFMMVGIALGDAAIAGLEFGFQYFFIGFGLSLAVTSGTISVVSRLKGADRHARADLAVKQSLWLALAISLPLTAIAWVFAEPLVGLLTGDPVAIDLGGTYLRLVMLALPFRFFSMVASRALAGGADTETPMYVRLLTLPTNIALNAVLIFGLGPAPRLGIAGAALGTVIANAVAAAVFFGLLVSGRFTVALRPGGRQVDLGLVAEIVRVAAPLAGMRLLQTFGRFPFLFVLGVLGTPVVAAYAIGRRAIMLAMMPAWGYATAASTLVGQAIGRGEDSEATGYGWQTLRIALATQLPVAALLVIAARPIALAFGTEHVGLTVTFVRVFGLAVAGFSVSRTMRGSLRGAGDTRWPLYGTTLGTYAVRLPIAALALPAGYAITVAGVSIPIGLGLGLPAVFVAIVADFYVRAVVNTGRFRSGAWQAVARQSGVGAGDD
ncbi:DNA damage-inducible protein [Halorhabdus tiamatea SARL4B]|uniref:Multidrug-efflux transporter n=1 Tax=Halorhabdus tiamatea SARL4B TaxID=1033806 RepID=F7PNX5_9EURY|nr:MATE family efflux transporter [Halorhabdus tiamatea]ERJ05362.1 DNA damage-inducible protein [Halorhabdus tiamatea SARL4B]CCQ33632.1 MATE efflux family protein [Halorhabdus tiamatea SARL4B]